MPAESAGLASLGNHPTAGFRFIGRLLDGGERSSGETVTEHRQTADGLGFVRLVLKHVPVLCELAVFDADDIGGDPGGGASNTREPAMRDDVFALGDDEL